MDISIHAPREGGRPAGRMVEWFREHISIHAPREGGDAVDHDGVAYRILISIHAPREGGDSSAYAQPSRYHQFQFTPPARGATMAQVHPLK